jgi:hypothetical protein
MTFYVSCKVVCTNARKWPRYPKPVTLPTEGAVYTIRAIVDCHALGYDEDGLLLEEIVNPVCLRDSPSGPFRGEVCFRISRFRPVRTTSIEVFQKMLEPVPQEPTELVDA